MFKRSKLENEMGKLARQSGVFFETGKIKLQITQLENDLYNLKAELGDVVYKAFQNKTLQGEEADREIEGICIKIKDVESQIDELKNSAEKINKT